jgi:hypothetical protein
MIFLAELQTKSSSIAISSLKLHHLTFSVVINALVNSLPVNLS